MNALPVTHQLLMMCLDMQMLSRSAIVIGLHMQLLHASAFVTSPLFSTELS